MSIDIVKQIPHVATEYELKAAAEGTLRAIIVPLVPEIETKAYGWRYWSSPTSDAILAFAPDEIPFSYPGSYAQLKWQVGDRLYLQQHWFEVESIKVCQCVELRIDDAENAGLVDVSKDYSFAAHMVRSGQLKQRWNAAYPDHLWDSEDWVVVLGIKPMLQSIGIDAGAAGEDRAVYTVHPEATLPDLVKALGQMAHIPHYSCEDPYYNCPKHSEGTANDEAGDECDCGADEHNAIADTLLSRIIKRFE